MDDDVEGVWLKAGPPDEWACGKDTTEEEMGCCWLAKVLLLKSAKKRRKKNNCLLTLTENPLQCWQANSPLCEAPAPLT